MTDHPNVVPNSSRANASHRAFILFYAGFYAGCFATVALAMLWARVL